MHLECVRWKPVQAFPHRIRNEDTSPEARHGDVDSLRKRLQDYCGIKLPDGMKKNQKLWENLITPTTKSDEHDELIESRKKSSQTAG